MDEKKSTPIFNKSMWTARIEEYLLKISTDGTVVDYDTLTEVAGIPVTHGRGYACLTSAMRIVGREKDVVWGRLRGQFKIKCCTADDKMSRANDYRKRAHNSARRGVKELMTIDSSAVTGDQRTQLMTQLAVMGTIADATSSRTVKKIEAKNIQAPLDLTRLLENIQ